MKKEIWIDIEGFEELYQVSNRGRVRSKQLSLEEISRTRPIKKISDRGRVELFKDNKRHQIYVHRLVAQAFVQKYIETDNIVIHADGDTKNNHAENLRWVGFMENIRRFINKREKWIRKERTERKAKRIARNPYKSKIDKKALLVPLSSKNPEVWRRVVGYENTHEVSNLGQVRSINGKVCKLNVKPNGFVTVHFANKTHLLHQVVANAHIPNPQGLRIVNHENYNTLDCRAENLSWISEHENRALRRYMGKKKAPRID